MSHNHKNYIKRIIFVTSIGWLIVRQLTIKKGTKATFILSYFQSDKQRLIKKPKMNAEE